MKDINIKMLILAAMVAIVIWFIPTPAGLEDNAWHLFAIFIATIVGIIAKAAPMGAMAIIGITAVAVAGVLDPSPKISMQLALSGFSNTVIWLIVLAFFIARGFIKTGLGKRISYMLVRLMGKKSLGLSYGLLGADLILAPAIPSNTARAGGVIYPIMKSLALSFDSKPDSDESRRKIGAFLTMTTYHGNLVTSAMFLTAMAANPLAAKLAGDLGVEISWGLWALAACVPGVISLILVPWILYKVYPPTITKTPNATKMAKEKLAEMGSVSKSEWIMLVCFIVLIVLWIFGKQIGIHGTAAAMVGLAGLLVTNVLSWDDIKSEKGAWDTLVWFSALVMMATFLNKLGFIGWFGELVKAQVDGMAWSTAFPIITLVYFFSHYIFASSTAHVAAMYAAFLAVGIAVGVPGMLLALTLGFFSNLYGALTHYGQGTAPVLFGGGYVTLKEWWKLGFMMSIVYIIIWMGIGGAWWKVLGIW